MLPALLPPLSKLDLYALGKNLRPLDSPQRLNAETFSMLPLADEYISPPMVKAFCEATRSCDHINVANRASRFNWMLVFTEQYV